MTMFRPPKEKRVKKRREGEFKTEEGRKREVSIANN
jgi:hypothetical protein